MLYFLLIKYYYKCRRSLGEIKNNRHPFVDKQGMTVNIIAHQGPYLKQSVPPPIDLILDIPTYPAQIQSLTVLKIKSSCI